MKKVLIVIVAIIAIGVAALNTPVTDQAHDTWQPGPKGAPVYGNDII